ncbi:MAG: lysine 5,6-aminomutase subunit alpha [Clostridia bacterium]
MKLDIDITKVQRARMLAKELAKGVISTAKNNTTKTQERAVARLFGIDGVSNEGIPLPNVIVNHIYDKGLLNQGVAKYILNGVKQLQISPQKLAKKVANNQVDLEELIQLDYSEIRESAEAYAKEALSSIKKNSETREEYKTKYPMSDTPHLYVIVATGNIYEDLTQAKAAARQGADIIAVIRSTGQSLLDYVPYGPTKKGFGGTYATQKNFEIMRNGLDEVSKEVGRYIYLVNYCSGLCMPEIAVMGAFERVDMMLNDSMYGILFRDINMKRTFIDQHFSRMINAYAGVVINTGEDNYLTTADAFEEGHTVLASQFINEQLGLMSGLKEDQLGLGHAYEIDPDIENSMLYEIAKAQLSRDIFPNSPLKFMPPTKYMTGDIFQGQVLDAMFNLTTVLTGQGIHLLGMLTEAIHTPFMQDRAAAIKNARYIKKAALNLIDEVNYKKDGLINNYANDVLDEAVEMLEEISTIGLEDAFSDGMFANIKRYPDGGKGLDGVVEKDQAYYNPFMDRFEEELGLVGGKNDNN